MKETPIEVKKLAEELRYVLLTEENCEFLGMLYGRWQDEKEFEDWNEYATVIKKRFQHIKACKIIRITRGFKLDIVMKGYMFLYSTKENRLRYRVLSPAEVKKYNKPTNPIKGDTTMTNTTAATTSAKPAMKSRFSPEAKAAMKEDVRRLTDKHYPNGSKAVQAGQLSGGERKGQTPYVSKEKQAMQKTATQKTRTEKALARTPKNEVGIKIGTVEEATYNALKKGGTFDQIMGMVEKTVNDAKTDSVRWYISNIRNVRKVSVQCEEGKYFIGKPSAKAAVDKAKAAPKKAAKPAPKKAAKKAAKK